MNSQNGRSDIVIPSRPLTLLAQAGFGLAGRIQAKPVEHDLFQEGEVLWAMILPDLAGVLAERDIKHPVKPILNATNAPARSAPSLR